MLVRSQLALACLLGALASLAGAARAEEALRSRVEAESASLDLADSLQAMQDALVTRSGSEATERAQVEIQLTIAQLEDLARLLREGASQPQIEERFGTLEAQRRRLAAFSAARGDTTLPKEIVAAVAERWAALAAYVASPR
jgi:hypothetical protein